MRGAEFTKLMRNRVRDTEQQELPALVAAYEKILGHVQREAVAGFKSEALIAAQWQPPPEGNMVDEAAVAAYATAQLQKLHRKVVVSVAGPTFVRLGISWDVTNPYVAQLLGQSGKRIGKAVDEAVSPRLREIVLGAYERGLSALDTAALISEQLTEFRPASARMLARTDLNGLANGASVMAATVAGVGFKQWLTASDDRVREQHVEADGQTVPVDQPFQVCGEELMFPGDPAASDECSANCRCTVVYVDGVEEAVVASSNGASAAPVSVQVAAASTSPETEAVVQKMAELVEQLGATLERCGGR